MLYREATVLPHDHAVTFYDDDPELVASIAEFIADGISRGEWTVAVATAEHRTMLDDELLRRGLDSAKARESGQLLVLDADETLATFLQDGVLDQASFRRSVTSLLEAAEAKQAPVRIFGEMVALLWERGNVTGAIELEVMWNELAAARRFALQCAYPVAVVGRAPLDDLDHVCAVHSSLTPPQSYGSSDRSGHAGTPVTGRSSRAFVCVPSAVPAARRFVAEVLRDWGQLETIRDAVLVASELATNALQHSGSPFRVSVDRSGPSVRIAVEDLGGSHPALCAPTPDATWGRGVFIVDDISRAWGTDPLPQGKVVWAELKAPN